MNNLWSPDSTYLLGALPFCYFVQDSSARSWSTSTKMWTDAGKKDPVEHDPLPSSTYRYDSRPSQFLAGSSKGCSYNLSYGEKNVLNFVMFPLVLNRLAWWVSGVFRMGMRLLRSHLLHHQCSLVLTRRGTFLSLLSPNFFRISFFCCYLLILKLLFCIQFNRLFY